MHISIFIMEFQSITHLTNGTRDGIPDDNRLGPSPADVIKYSYQDPLHLALRFLLLHRMGVTSFEDHRTVDGQVQATFKDVAKAMGLLEDDTEHRCCLQRSHTFY